MGRSAFTLRLPGDTRSALESLSKIERRPINQLVTEAVDAYLQRSRPEEQSLAASIDALRRYRERDPDFEQAAASFVDSEATLHDPVEGTVIETAVAVPAREAALQGKDSHDESAQSVIDEILNA